MGWFSDIPRHNQMDVLKKLTFPHFARFKRCSKETVEITKNFNHPLALEMPVWHIIFHSNSCKMVISGLLEHEHRIRLRTYEFCLVETMSADGFNCLKDFCRQTLLKVDKFEVDREKGDNDTTTIDSLIKLLKVDELYIRGYSSSEILHLCSKNITLHSVNLNVKLEDAEFVQLKMPEIQIEEETISFSAIETFLKEWSDGQRQIKELAVLLSPEDYLKLLDGQQYSTLWSPEIDRSSPFRNERIAGRSGEDFENLHKIYSVNAEDGKRKIFIALFGNGTEHMITVKEYNENNEVSQWIRSRFSDDDY